MVEEQWLLPLVKGIPLWQTLVQWYVNLCLVGIKELPCHAHYKITRLSYTPFVSNKSYVLENPWA
jgi:hypothetical protein